MANESDQLCYCFDNLFVGYVADSSEMWFPEACPEHCIVYENTNLDQQFIPVCLFEDDILFLGFSNALPNISFNLVRVIFDYDFILNFLRFLFVPSPLHQTSLSNDTGSKFFIRFFCQCSCKFPKISLKHKIMSKSNDYIC